LFHARKKKNQVPTSYLQDSPLSFFVLRVAQVKKAKDFFANELHTRAVEVWEAKKAIKSAWAGLLPQKGNVRKKRKEKKRTEKDQGRWSVATRRGREKKKKKKKKTMEGKKVATAKARFCVPYTENFFFWFTSIWAWKQPVLVEVLAPTRLDLRGSHVRTKFRKRTNLRSKSSTLK
jgi:hypothetical protein